MQYYSNEFVKKDLKTATMPIFQGNNQEIENSTEVSAMGETKSHLGLVVTIQSEKQVTLVTIQVKGNSILFLPS